MFSFYPKNSRTGSKKASMTQECLVIESFTADTTASMP